MGLLVEKPLVLDSAEARTLADLAREKGLPLGVNHNAVYHPAFARLLRRVRRGVIGKLDHVQVTLSVPLRQLDAGDFSHWMFAAPRNIVFEQGPHPFAQLHELVGRVRSAQVTRLGTRELLPGQVFHDRWLVAAKGERATAEVLLSFGSAFTRSTVQALGSDGSVQADLHHDQVEVETKTQWIEFWNTVVAGFRRGLGLQWGALVGLAGYAGQTLGLCERKDHFYVGMRGSIRAFHRALRAGEDPPQDGETAARVLEGCEAATAGASAEAAPSLDGGEPPPARPGEVVVLGANGFLGRRVVAGLLEEGRPVTAVVRRLHSLPPVITEGVRAGSIRLLRADLADADATRRALAGAATVVHLATGGGDTWEAVERSMVRGTVDVAEACLDAGVGRLVYVSSIAALYLGHDCGRDLVEDDEPVDPQPNERPVYARGKLVTEQELLRLHRERGLPVVIVRPGVVLGEGTPMQHSGLGLWVRDNHCVGWGLGRHPLPLVSADDVASALVSLTSYGEDDLHGRALDLCARPPLTAEDVVEAMGEASGRRLHFHPRPLWLSQAFGIGKWLVKKAGRRKDAPFPSWRDLKSRALVPPFSSRLAREKLGWRPVEERGAFLELCVRRPYGESSEAGTEPAAPTSRPAQEPVRTPAGQV